MTSQLDTFFKETLASVEQTSVIEELMTLRQKLMSKTSPFTQAMKGLKHLPSSERQQEGQRLNNLKEHFMQQWLKRKNVLENQEIDTQCKQEAVDLSCDGHQSQGIGHIHILSATVRHIVRFFKKEGFRLHEGPEIETTAFNFDALNIPADHPARTSHDTFYIKNTPFLLRTHTSPVQIRTARKHGLPLRIISAGRVFRDDSDATHTPMFHQIEGLVIEEGLHMGHLKGCLKNFLEHFFEKKVCLRFRPNYFPFTEPSAEVDILSEEGKWLEVLGCGMVHPKVLRNMGFEPETTQGFAFGMGAERLTMLREALPDLRAFFSGDPRWTQAHTPFLQRFLA